MIKGVSRDHNWANSPSAGIGYICIPFGEDRDKYVKTCYRRERVFLQIDQGGTMVKNCPIDPQVLQKIKFPESYKELGSTVVYVSQKFNNKPIIVASLSKTRDRVLGSEETINIQRSLNGGTLSIVGKGNGKLLINLDSENKSELILRVKGENSEINLECDGEINIVSEDKNLKINSEGLLYSDDKKNKLFIDYEKSTISHHEGSEPIPLGSTLKEELDKLNKIVNTFLDTYLNTTVAPSDGGLAVQTAVKLATVSLSEADFNDINSQKSFID